MSSTETITTSTFDGLVFPVAKVRYTGNGYSATVCARGALPAAEKAFAKALADNDGLAREGDYVAVPGDLNADFYTFTFVPKHFFGAR